MSAKRSNPFEDDFVPQSKIHVGLKQFNNNNDRLQKVYVKTLQMLFRGAKNIPAFTNCNSTSEEANVSKADNLKQLFINKDGTLLHTGACLITADGKQKLCTCTQIGTEQCAYCESPLCSRCQTPCVRCSGSFCSKCILIWSEGEEMCLSCYT